ncbi:hypothetical protein [Streptomyces sp. YIM S03343]
MDGKEVRAAHIKQLIRGAAMPNVTLQVMPTAKGAHMGEVACVEVAFVNGVIPAGFERRQFRTSTRRG